MNEKQMNLDQIIQQSPIDLDQLESRDHSKYRSSWTMYLAAFSAHMASITLGSTYGWNSPAMEEMNENFTGHHGEWKSPFLPTDKEKRFISSVLTIGAIIGGFLCGLLIDRLGRRKTLMSLGIPYTLGWTLIGLSTTTAMIIIGRIITGLGIGIAIATVPTYLTEIATPNNRGYLGMTFNFFVVFGIFYMDMMNIFNFHWNQLAFWALLPTFLLMILMYFMPESPTWCINCIKDKNESIRLAVINLKRLRTNDSDIQNELNDLLDYKKQSDMNRKNHLKFSWNIFKRRDVYIPMIMAIVLLFFQQFSGINAVQFYMNDIFNGFNSNINTKYSTLISNTFMLLSTIVGTFIIDRFGRRLLLILSSFGMSFSIGLLGFYYYYEQQNLIDNNSTINHNQSLSMSSIAAEYLPIICLSIFVCSFSLGIGPIAWIIITEITPPKSVQIITSIASIFAWIYTFIIVNETKIFFQIFTQYGTYWLFSAINFVCVLFSYFYLPETKGKTIEEIGKIFNYC